MTDTNRLTRHFKPQTILSPEDKRTASKVGMTADEALKQINDANRRFYDRDDAFRPSRISTRRL